MIVSMKKVTVAFMAADLEKVTEMLQRCGQFMPIKTEETTDIKAVSSPILNEEAETALKAYSKYRKKPGMLTAAASYTEEEFAAEKSEDKAAVIKAVELYEKLNFTQTQLEQCAAEKAALIPYLELDIDASDFSGTKYTDFIIGKIPYPAKPKTEAPLDAVCRGFGVSYTVFYEEGGKKYFYCSVFKDDAEEFLSGLSSAGFEPLSPPYKSGTAKEELSRIEHKIDQLQFVSDSVSKQLEAEAENAPAAELFYDREKAKADRSDIPAYVTDKTVILTGWVCSDKVSDVESAVKKATDVYSISSEDPAEGEQAPSVTRDPYVIDQYSTITNSFSPPGKNDIDPNPFMAPWYFLQFGMIIGDWGYGILTGVVLLLYKLIKKPRGETGKLINVMMFSSIPAVFWGFMFGSFFGEKFPEPILFSPLEQILPAMILVMVVGVLHLFTGMIIKAVMNVKAGKWLDALTDQIAWMALLCGIGLLFLPGASTAGIITVAVSVAVILILGGHAKKNVLGKMTGGLISLYGITGYLSDILSYLRIFALALASGLIGMVMNVMASMVAGGIPVPVLNMVATIPIYVLGHGLNTALSLLGAYVHTGRLQYIEFFGKFYEGNGKYFKPLERKNKYTQINKK